MPIEIRELIIKTEIVSSNAKHSSVAKEKELSLFKKQVLEECKRLIAEKNQVNSYKR
ncbi:MAG: DUF5908 family protein [Flavobacterium circumlabens]|uniref:Uncharacterized protein n=1 Tax=Flavobacterium circumlabens TaxID=2133765 RepID=A0ABY2B2A4_9FLAO|nr:DUF5908 family protein [Flavobacterium circumlabens]TCN59968.1 hypothetical protein EV142_102588 [Flavobacterium circumlabens]